MDKKVFWTGLLMWWGCTCWCCLAVPNEREESQAWEAQSLLGPAACSDKFPLLLLPRCPSILWWERGVSGPNIPWWERGVSVSHCCLLTFFQNSPLIGSCLIIRVYSGLTGEEQRNGSMAFCLDQKLCFYIIFWSWVLFYRGNIHIV